MTQQEALTDERRIHSVAAFNRGLAGYVDRLNRDYWVEGELSELSRNERWAYVYLTLKDPRSGATLPLTMFRQAFDRLPPPHAPAPGPPRPVGVVPPAFGRARGAARRRRAGDRRRPAAAARAERPA